jgi:phosphatidylinositol 4-kinase
MDTNQVAPEFLVPNTSYKLRVLDTLEGRESTVNDFTQRCSHILQEALEFAPITAKSHIQNYMLQLQQRGDNIYNHSGTSMVLECVMKYSKPRSDLPDSTRPDCIKKDFSNFIGQMNEKYNYVGIVEGLRKNLTESVLVKNLCLEMKQMCLKRNEKKLKDAMLKAAAFLTPQSTKQSTLTTNIFERELLHEISICCSSLFTKQIIEVAIESWSWIISSRPDIELLVVEEMTNAWQMTVELRLGMFCETREEPNPLAKAEKEELKPQPPPNINAHRIWIKYFQERLDIAKYKSEFETELFFNLMHKTLAFSMERIEDACLNRHVSCVGLRFRFLVMAISIVQSSNALLPNTVAKWILRERIYFTALDYFTMISHVPTQSYVELHEDIKFLLEFWHKMVAEKKYLKEENFLLTGNYNSSVVNAGSSTPDANSMAGNEGKKMKK